MSLLFTVFLLAEIFIGVVATVFWGSGKSISLRSEKVFIGMWQKYFLVVSTDNRRKNLNTFVPPTGNHLHKLDKNCENLQNHEMANELISTFELFPPPLPHAPSKRQGYLFDF